MDPARGPDEVITIESADDWAYATGVSRPDQVQQQVARTAGDRIAGAPSSSAPSAPSGSAVGGPAPTPSGGGGTLFTEPVLVVNQRCGPAR